jgi:hypothetical protein
MRNMARKTRKEKIIANLRRELKATKTNVPKKAKQPASSAPTNTTAYVINDLKRTLVLSTLAISLELMLYFTLK